MRASFCSWQAYLGMINSSWLIKRLEMLRHDFSMLPHCWFMTAPFQSKNSSQPFPKNVDWLQDMRLFRTFFHIINGQICSDWFSVLAVRSPFIRISQCLCFSLCWSFLGSTKPQWGKCLSAPWLTPVTLHFSHAVRYVSAPFLSCDGCAAFPVVERTEGKEITYLNKVNKLTTQTLQILKDV